MWVFEEFLPGALFIRHQSCVTSQLRSRLHSRLHVTASQPPCRSSHAPRLTRFPIQGVRHADRSGNCRSSGCGAAASLSEAKTTSPDNANFTFTIELESHLLPGMRIRTPQSAADTPPFALDLFVGIPIAELRALANANITQQDQLIAHFGATFSPRLLRATQHFSSPTIYYEAGCQSGPGTSSLILERGSLTFYIEGMHRSLADTGTRWLRARNKLLYGHRYAS